MAKPAEPAQAVKFNPIAWGSVALSLVGAALYLAPLVGIKIPVKVSKAANVAMTLGTSLGAKLLLKPA